MAFRRTTVIALALGTACCVAPKPAPTPRPPASITTPRPSPSPTPAATYASWMDVPQTAGDWRYAATAGSTAATFGNGPTESLFRIRCARDTRSVELARTGSFASGATMTVRSESATRTLASAPVGNNLAFSTYLSARDPLLDAMAFSKGRFAIELAGASTLYLPSWPEVTRVIEDCR